MGVHHFTVYDMFKRNARLFKNATALADADERITFGDLQKQVQSLSGSLASQGVHQGDRLAILAQNNHHCFLLYGAAAAMGAIIVPINWRLSIEEIQYILLDSGASAIFFDENNVDLVSCLSSKCPSLKKFIFSGSGNDYISFNELRGDFPAEKAEVKRTDPYLIVYTAAVKGKPRGAILSQDNIISCSIQVASVMGLTPNDAHLNMLPLFHIAGFALAFSVMYVGGKNVIIPKFDPQAVLGEIEKERVTLMCIFPPIPSKLLDEISERTYDLSSLKHVFGLASPETIREFEEKTGSQFWLAYGQTETTGLTCLCRNLEKPGSAGRQGPLVDLKIVDEFDHEIDSGNAGEILFRGPLVFQGYWEQEELTRYVFRGGWHHTGDLGRLDEDGYLWFVGRKPEKELIKPGGENVYPEEVEKVILEHPSINEVTVIGVPDPKFGEGVKAVCVLRQNAILSEQDLIDFVATKIARYKKPRYVSFVDSLPKKGDGTIDREKVKAMYG